MRIPEVKNQFVFLANVNPLHMSVKRLGIKFRRPHHVSASRFKDAFPDLFCGAVFLSTGHVGVALPRNLPAVHPALIMLPAMLTEQLFCERIPLALPMFLWEVRRAFHDTGLYLRKGIAPNDGLVIILQ